jgi:hypothetical protein
MYFETALTEISKSDSEVAIETPRFEMVWIYFEAKFETTLKKNRNHACLQV